MSKKLDPKITEALMLSAGFKPLEPYKNALSNWKCRHIACGKIVFPRYNSIQQGSGGCLTCGHSTGGAKSRISKSELNKRLKQKKLKLVGEYVTVAKPFKIQCFICEKFSETTLDTLSKKSRGAGCEKCRRQTAGLVQNNVATKEMIKKGLRPLEAYRGRNVPWLCECLICHQQKKLSRTSISRRASQFKGCIQCAKKMQNEKRIQDSMRIVLKRFHLKNLELLSEYKSASLPIKVRCKKCGHTFEAIGAQISRQKYACAKCAGNFVNSEEAVQFMQENGLQPLAPFKGSHISWKSLHIKCGKEVTPTYSSIKTGHGGCKHCAKYGIQYSKPAYLYLITNPNLRALKVGIANPTKIKKSDRLHRYKFHGWIVIKIWEFETGKIAELVENRILTHLRINLAIPQFLTSKEMAGQGGHTETIDADLITLVELEKIIKKVIKGCRQ